MLRYSYEDEPLTGPAPPSLPPGTLVRWRPLVPVTVIGPGGLQPDFGRAILDLSGISTTALGLRNFMVSSFRASGRGRLEPRSSLLTKPE
jgi:hypothetical protein